MIPESAPVYTSVTARTPREFENRFGTFSYRNERAGGYFAVRSLR